MTSESNAGSRYRLAIGRAIAGYRSRRGLSLRALAETSGVSVAYLSEIEHGQKEPSSGTLSQLAGALDVTLPDLLREIVDQLETDAAPLEISVDDLPPEEIEELARYADWLRWRRSRD